MEWGTGCPNFARTQEQNPGAEPRSRTPGAEPRSREDFLRYSPQITLNPNSVNKHLLLSEEDRKVTHMEEDQPYGDHPDRFTDCYQVLSREGLTGRCYWEVQWRGRELGWWGVRLAVAYRNISRTGESGESELGFNDKSWCLECSSFGFLFYHNRIWTRVPGPESSRVGVFLDHRAGLLSFYSVSGSMELLHRIRTSFTQPLHVGLWLHRTLHCTNEVPGPGQHLDGVCILRRPGPPSEGRSLGGVVPKPRAAARYWSVGHVSEQTWRRRHLLATPGTHRTGATDNTLTSN
ncbi:tripartite motif-containing protein 14-like [Nelusetta ayraudi]|uniref:tripartite motif-containing protein 14-like n=1 Tax=Nelusetta ayraudi TaxID=303726 RepID=UPI003F6E5C71